MLSLLLILVVHCWLICCGHAARKSPQVARSLVHHGLHASEKMAQVATPFPFHRRGYGPLTFIFILEPRPRGLYVLQKVSLISL